MTSPPAPPFARRVTEGMSRRGLTLRRFCRAVELDASFFSKVLSGKRSPPADEAVLRRIARVLELDEAELIVAAGRIPSEWRALWGDPGLFRDVHDLATGSAPAARPAAKPAQAAIARRPAFGRTAAGTAHAGIPARPELAEELL